MPPYSYAQPQRSLISQTDVATIENAHVPRSKFKNQWSRKTAFDAGYLIPILVDEILPGDHMSYDITAYLRMATPLFPLFDTLRVDTHFFFVPCRLVWDNWVKFMGEQATPTDTINFLVPQVTFLTGAGQVQPGSIGDHFGIPGAGQYVAGEGYTVNALPFRAYNLIFNQWFRDENLTTAMVVLKDNGPDASANYFIAVRAKSHDYFTSALPWPQKFTAPTVPIGGLAPVSGLGIGSVGTNVSGNFYETGDPGNLHAFAKYSQPSTAFGGTANAWAMRTDAAGYPAIYADLAATSGVAINTLRQAFLVQSLLERDARGGTRYVELVRSHFGVINPDFRLQRPEYIGGGQSPLNITPVAQTAPTAGLAVGSLGAAGTASGTHRASYAATEHGYIIGLISVKSELSYQQGLHKMWSRLTRYDFYWPTLAGLGEQAVLTKEIYFNQIATNDTVFGYQERWQEYRTRYSDVTGVMRSTYTLPLDMWHLAQKFTAAPVLNTTFINDTPPMTRVLAAAGATTGQQFLADILYHRTAVRPIPTYGTPINLARF